MSNIFQTDAFSLIVVMVGMSLLPFLAMVATSYLKIVVVMSLVRNALGVQSIPPNMVINALALILTLYVMAPVIGEGWDAMREKTKDKTAVAVVYETDLMMEAAEPFRAFLERNVDEKQRAFFVKTAEKLWAKRRIDANGKAVVIPAKVDERSFYILLPAFCVSELATAFEVGFLVYLPFIVVDLIISNILLAMGMMMVSPVTISIPFKLLLFVMVSGWSRLIQSLVQCYVM